MIFSSLPCLDVGSGKEGYRDAVSQDQTIMGVDMPLVMDLYKTI